MAEMRHEKQERTAGDEPNEQASPSLRAVVYVRISDDPEGTERDVDRQEVDCRAYAVHGWEVVAVYRENDTSAFKQRTIMRVPNPHRAARDAKARAAMLRAEADELRSLPANDAARQIEAKRAEHEARQRHLPNASGYPAGRTRPAPQRLPPRRARSRPVSVQRRPLALVRPGIGQEAMAASSVECSAT